MKFTVHSYYEALRGAIGVSFPWRSVLGAKVPRNVAFFSWTDLDSILTVGGLWDCNMFIVD